jgi:prepilin-type N-terminal cleavage/methylation domain-containing protein
MLDNNSPSSTQQGFALIELSIVLVIIGLIVGAITSGSSLIKQATLRAVVSEVRNYQIAINTFKLAYNALPGDFNKATAYWPTAPGLLDGDGNGLIERRAIASENETLRSWQMLSLAGLIAENIGYNAYPSSKYSKTAQYIMLYNDYYSTIAADATANGLYGKLGNLLSLSALGVTNGWWVPKVTPSDAYDIDLKMDDGVFYTGIVYSSKKGNVSTANRCTTVTGTIAKTSFVATDIYATKDTTASCWMHFWIVD